MTLQLSNSQLISIGVNLGVLLIILITSIILIKKTKLDQSGYKYLFVLYAMFWIPVMLIRPYRSTIQNIIDPSFLWIATAAYGMIGIFARLFADVINHWFRYRKAFLYICIIGQMALLIPLLIHINTTNNVLSSLAIGLGASCIGSFELLFKEQYGKRKAFLTVSLLSIPPLIADFLTAPVQSIVKTAATNSQGVVDPKVLLIMWIIAFGFLIICLIMLFFLKERPSPVSLFNKKYYSLQQSKPTQNHWLLFISLALIGSVIAFVKFTNSGAMGTLHLQNLAKYNGLTSSAYEGYISIIFSLSQLIGGVLIGTYLIRKMKAQSIFLIGASVWIIYCLSAAFVRNPYAYLALHSLNGFGYGILYNLILGIVLSITVENKMFTKMGIYQSILAIGITVSGWFTNYIKSLLKTNFDDFNSYMYAYMIQNMILLGVIVLITICYLIISYKTNHPYESIKEVIKTKEYHKIKKY